MATEAKVLDLVGRIYEAAVEPERWALLLEDIADTLNGVQVVLPVLNKKDPGASLAISARTDPDMVDRYLGHYHAVDPWLKGFFSFREGVTVSSPDLVAPERFVDSEHYNDFLRPQDIFHAAAVLIQNDSARFSFLNVMRPRRAGDFGAHDHKILKCLLPHLRRGLNLFERLGHGALQAAAFDLVLDRLADGAVVIDGNRRVIFANERAETLVASSDGLTVRQERLHATRHEDEGRLAEAVRNALALSAGQESVAREILVIRRRDCDAPLQVVVAPLPVQKLPGFSGASISEAAAVVFIHDSSAERKASTEILRALYGLTAAEAHFLAAFVDEPSLKVVAERLAITEGSARIYMKRVFAKTGVKSQAALMKLVLSGLAALARPGRLADR